MSDKFNVFVPMFAPQYRTMVERGGRPGVSLEDRTRGGVWVPHEWLEASQPVKEARWQPLSAEALRAIYPSKRNYGK
jgi:hypothetical protein